MNKIAVLINFYKETLSDNEILSVKQCVKVLKNYHIYLFGPDNVNLDIYKEHAPEAKLFLVESRKFSGLVNYNKYVLSDDFYNSFINYDYILIYQLDCFVFSDQLNYWSQKGYSYIGAPFFENFENNKNNKFAAVGNSGFCLRSPKHFIAYLEKWERKTPLISIVKARNVFKRSDKIRLIIYKLLSLITFGNYHKPFSEILKNPKDDLIISFFMAQKLNVIKTPSPEEASKFSFETNCKYLYKINNNSLPFGCHAWGKYEPEFWKDFIGKDHLLLPEINHE